MISMRSRSCFASQSTTTEAETPAPIWRRRAAYQFSLVAIVCFLALTGCRRDPHSAGEREGLEEHVGHVIPAHKPKDFPSAVRRLRELNDQIVSKLADGKARSLVAEKTLPIALDIANWLPEIAAGCDMPEPPWNEVNARSATLVADYQKIMTGAASDNRPADSPALTIEASTTIKALETLLDSADPRWFDSTKPGVKR
jgi:hypothetical protein